MIQTPQDPDLPVQKVMAESMSGSVGQAMVQGVASTAPVFSEETVRYEV